MRYELRLALVERNRLRVLHLALLHQAIVRDGSFVILKNLIVIFNQDIRVLVVGNQLVWISHSDGREVFVFAISLVSLLSVIMVIILLVKHLIVLRLSYTAIVFVF